MPLTAPIRKGAKSFMYGLSLAPARQKVNEQTEREARKLAKEVVSDEYAVIDEIWNRRRVNYHSVAADYDRDTIKDINRKLPNLLVKNGGVALDELADEYGFESTCDLIDMFLAYTPKRVRLEQLVAQFLEENPQPSGDYDGDVPF